MVEQIKSFSINNQTLVAFFAFFSHLRCICLICRLFLSCYLINNLIQIKKMVSPADLKKLRTSIPYGGLKQVHVRFNELQKSKQEDEVSYEMIVAVLNGIVFRQDIINCAIDYVLELKKTEELESNRLSERIKQATA